MLNQVTHPLLVVEDSDIDFDVLTTLMKQRSITNPIYRCSDGDEALDFLHREGEFSDPLAAPRPGVVLLDLNLPGTDGREVLEKVKQDKQLQSVPIVVFTTSKNPNDIEFCYRHGANGYLIKPIQMNQLQLTVQAFIDYWLEANHPPDIG